MNLHDAHVILCPTSFPQYERTHGPGPRLPPDQMLLQSLHEACIAGDADAVSRAVGAGADIRKRDNVTQMGGGYDALHYGALYSKAGVVDLLLGMGANASARTGDYLLETAMHCAGRGGSVEVTPPCRRIARPSRPAPV